MNDDDLSKEALVSELQALRRRVAQLEAQGASSKQAIVASEKESVTAHLRVERDFLDAILQTSVAAILAVDPQGQIIFVNERAEDILGVNTNQIIGQPHNAPVWHITNLEGHPLEEEELPFARVMTTGEPVFGAELAIEPVEGRRRFFSINGAPVKDEAGHLVQVVFSVEDIAERLQAEATIRQSNEDLERRVRERTAELEAVNQTLLTKNAEREQAEHALLQSEQRFRTFFEASAVGVAVSSMDGHLIQTNQAFQDMVGYTEYELHNMTFWDFTHPDDIEEEQQNIAVAEASPEPAVFQYEKRYIRKDDETIWVRLTVSTIMGDDGTPQFGLGVVEDITEQKQAREERERLINELEAKNTELERFTYTVSHDLKSPLVTIKGFLGLLEKDMARGDAEQAQKDIAYIQQATHKMQQLLGELLELSRVGRMANPSEVLGLTDLAHEATDWVSGQITERGVIVEIEPDMPTVIGDRARLMEVFQNLIDNAVKYMGDQPEPRVLIEARRQDEEVVCQVRDNGIGIAPRYHTKIFGLFERLDPRSEGTGVGLALAKRIVEVHGGRIWVESDGEGSGATFCFTLPQG